jgi:parallel beta-helix repeat protein
MTLTEARVILGLGADDDPRPHLAGFQALRERMAEMVRSAPNEELTRRHRESLVEFDRALAAVRGHLETPVMVIREEDVRVGVASEQKGTYIFVTANRVSDDVRLPAVPQPPAAEEDPEPSSGRIAGIFAWILVFVSLCGFGGWWYLKMEDDWRQAKIERIGFLERQAAIFIENRRWPEATEAFDEIEGIDPASALVPQGRRSIEDGKAEELNQFIGYWKGEAIASFEAKRWDDAEKAAKQVLDRSPGEEETKELVGRIAEAKRGEEREAAIAAIRELIAKRDFDAAITAAREFSVKDASDDVAALLKEAAAAKQKAEADLLAARDLMAQAAAMDKGEFDQAALDLMREAVSLAPGDAEVAARYEKMAAYTRTIRIPGDFGTVQQALSSSRDRDRLLIGEGIWEGPFLVSAAVELVGIPEKTIVQCPADTGGVISFAPGVKGARVSGLTLRHLSFDAGAERFSLALVHGAEAEFADCRFEQGSGHGIAVTGGGQARVLRCRFTENGWNGIAAMGEGSLLVAEGNTLDGNFQNGIEAWDGAAAILSKNRCTGNSRNGIHIDGGSTPSTVIGNTLSENREFGIVLSSAGGGEVTGNTMGKNLLGGMVVKAAAGGCAVKDNAITANEGPGLALAKGLSAYAYGSNRVTANKGEQIVTGVDLSEDE